MRNISIIFILSILFGYTVKAQTYQNLWITGSAVPEGTRQLQKTPDGEFRFAGTLKDGELKIMTTEKAGADTKYIAPKYEDSYIVNKGIEAELTSDAGKASWVVPFAEDRYRFYVSSDCKKLTGELFVPWEEAYVGGGATDAGWDAFKVELMKQSPENEMVWTWTGELKTHQNIEEPSSFKIMGLRNWGQKEIHPFVQGEDPLGTKLVRTNGDDTKWTITKDGTYRITVDVFNETFKAELISQ